MTDITRKRGDTYADEWIIKSAATGLPVDISGYTFRLTVDSRKDPDDETTKAFSIDGTILDAAAGRVEFAPSDAQADRVGAFFYDVQMIDGAGRKRTFDAGKYKLVQDITKA